MEHEDRKRNKVVLFIFGFTVCLLIFLVCCQINYSDGDDAYFYQYTRSMGFFEYLGWRYRTWVGRMSGEALVYIAFNAGIWFWRIVNAFMLVVLPAGLMELLCKTLGYGGYLDYAGKTCGSTNCKGRINWHILIVPMMMLTSYFLMDVMTLGYAAVWINGSIFYTWTFTCGVWALMPIADLVFGTGKGSNLQYLYAIPCAVIAAMSIEQMGAVVLAFEVLGLLACIIKKRKIPVLTILLTLITVTAFIILFAAPGNDIRVATETIAWMPQFEELTVGQHLFLTMQWLLSSFANEGKAFFCGIWVVGGLLLAERQMNPPKKMGGCKSVSKQTNSLLCCIAALFTIVALLPYAGVLFFSDMGLGQIDYTVCLTEVPTWMDMTLQNKIAMFWWIAAVLFTLVWIWMVSGRSVFMVFVYLGSIATEAILYFSPTIYASGERIYYLAGLMLFFLLMRILMLLSQKRYQVCAVCFLLLLAAVNFVAQIPVILQKVIIS